MSVFLHANVMTGGGGGGGLGSFKMGIFFQKDQHMIRGLELSASPDLCLTSQEGRGTGDWVNYQWPMT